MTEKPNPDTSRTNHPIQTSNSFKDLSLLQLIELIGTLIKKVDDTSKVEDGGKKQATSDDGASGSGGGGGEEGTAAVAAAKPGLCGTLLSMASSCGGGEEGAAAVAAAKPGLCGTLLSMASSCGGGDGAESSGQKAEPHGGESVRSPVSSGEGRKSEMDKLQSNLDQIKAALDVLQKFETEFRSGFRDRNEDIEQLLEALGSPSATPSDDAVVRRLREINKEVRKLKHRIPSSSSSTKAPGTAHPDDRARTSGSAEAGSSGAKTVEELLDLQTSKSFAESSLYDEVKRIYVGLGETEQKCLLCFALFAENEVVKKRMLAYWWEGEGFLAGKKNGGEIKPFKEAADEVLRKLAEKGLIEPVYKKRWTEAKRYRMKAVYRSATVQLAEEKDFFVFDEHGNLAAKYHDGSKKVALEESVRKSPLSPSSSSKRKKSPAEEKGGGRGDEVAEQNPIWLKKWNNAERLETIFNANEKFPDLRLKKLAKEKDLTDEEWLLKMKNLKVLYLGSWRASGKHHIEVDNPKFLDSIKNMSSLRLFSLQGISRISELTKSIEKLVNLEILDLKSCHNLEEIPDEIRYLKNLTHLDISNCYLIDHMPKGLASLKKLQVLKGFVVGDYRNQKGKFCTLEGLREMKSLRKLSVIVSKREFPTEAELGALEALTVLHILTLSWGANSAPQEKTSHEKEKEDANTSNDQAIRTGIFNYAPVWAPKISRSNTRKPEQEKRSGQLPQSLKKLDLQCYPHPTSPHWLSPGKLDKLEKLYIRGGKLGHNHGLSDAKKWSSVQTLRLKYLAAVKMSWEEMQSAFPSLTYLEKVDCPMITLCPCDEDGVWVKENFNKHESQQVEDKLA